MLRKLCTLLALCLISCSGGSGDSDSASLRNDACALLGLNVRIISGTDCEPDSSPVVPLILEFFSGDGALCTGTIIDSRHVLTAAHCFRIEKVKTITTVVNGAFFTATDVVAHPNFSTTPSKGKLPNDVAIVSFSRNLNNRTIPIRGSSSPSKGDVVSIFGYGSDGSGDLGELRSGEMQITSVSSSEFSSTYDGEGSNTCEGDSGGPAIQNYNGEIAISGITSTGTVESCGIGDTTVFSSLSSKEVIDFIKSVAPGARIL